MPQGAGRRRRIATPGGEHPARLLRVGLLVGDKADRRVDYIVELQHELEDAGHAAVHAPRAMIELGMNVKRIVAMVTANEADAGVVMSGSREVLEWFAARPSPAFALFGRRNGLPLAAVGPDKQKSAFHLCPRPTCLWSVL